VHQRRKGFGMRPPSRPPKPPGGNDRPPGGSDRPAGGPRRPSGDAAPRSPRASARQRPPRAADEVIVHSRREAEALDSRRSNSESRDDRRHILGGRLPKVPKSEPKAVPRPPRSGDRKPRNPAPFSDLPTAPPTGRRGRGDARVAARAAERAGTSGSRAVPVEPQRIAKLLARAGIGSRRDIERMIADGKVALGGQVLTTPATVVASLDGITVEGQPVAALEPSRLFRFHKPAGFLTTARDPGGRPTIMDILPPGLPRVVPVGRLDMNTEGLLLLTTDGALKRALELPMSGVPRRYRVRAYGEITQPAVESLIDGLTIDGMRYGPIDAEIERRTGRNLWLTITLTEGKNREIRRVLEFLGLQVSRLIRVAYGPIELGDLAPRDADEVPDGVVASLRKSLGKG